MNAEALKELPRMEPAVTPAASPHIVPTKSLLRRIRQVHDGITQRAYELFEGRGREDGHAIEDWFRAESEVFRPTPKWMMPAPRSKPSSTT